MTLGVLESQGFQGPQEPKVLEVQGVEVPWVLSLRVRRGLKVLRSQRTEGSSGLEWSQSSGVLRL